MERRDPGLPMDGKKTTNKEAASRTHGNSPFRDLHENGHDLNHSYKNPVANKSGVNHSYMHPHEGASNAPGFPVHQGAPISPLDQTGKGGK